MQTKYEDLLERSIKAQECSNNVSTSLLEIAKNLKENTKELNDNIVLHNLETQKTGCEIKAIKLELMKWLKYLAIALFIAVGGTSIVKLLLSGSLNNLI